MRLNRRTFLQRGAFATAGALLIGPARWARTAEANSKLNIGVIGVANRGGANLGGVSSENIVALCDIDERHLAQAGTRYPEATRYHDFRRMFDREKLDGVVVSTADHTHAVASMAALKLGLPVYCEKPLTHTVSEARAVSRAAREAGVATQMGTQIHAGDNYRRVVELVQTGAIGSVREVHCWVGGSWSGKGPFAETPPVPEYLHWDLWLGPVQNVPYHPIYHPANWRGYWRFGGGTMADMGCHHMDLPFWALHLTAPDTVEAEGPALDSFNAPEWLVVNYEFPHRGTLPPVKLTWYCGGKRPRYFEEGILPQWGDGTLFVGEKGMLLADYGKHQLLPKEKFEEFKKPEPFLESSMGHHQEWIHACKTGAPTTCHFGYAGPLSEAVLLGNVAYRAGEKLVWDQKEMRVKNVPSAEALVLHHYRKGWSL